MMIELWNSRERKTPEDVFKDLSKACVDLGVQSPDVYGDFDKTSAPEDGSYLRQFEREVASFTGKEDALFVPSGVMAQQIALLIHYEARKDGPKSKDRSFVCHYSSHLLIHEKEAYDELISMKPKIVPKKEGSRIQEPLTLKNICAAVASLPAGDLKTYRSGSRSVIPSSVVMECPHRELGGKVTHLEELKNISEYCRRNGIALHMDGARLWEALTYYQYAQPIKDAAHSASTTTTTTTTISGANGDSQSIVSGAAEQKSPTTTSVSATAKEVCGLFDSVYVSFYKGLGGMSGAMLLGDSNFIAQSRVWLRRFGGNLFTHLPYAVSAYKSFRNYILWNILPANCTGDGAESDVGAISISRKAAEGEDGENTGTGTGTAVGSSKISMANWKEVLSSATVQSVQSVQSVFKTNAAMASFSQLSVSSPASCPANTTNGNTTTATTTSTTTTTTAASPFVSSSSSSSSSSPSVLFSSGTTNNTTSSSNALPHHKYSMRARALRLQRVVALLSSLTMDAATPPVFSYLSSTTTPAENTTAPTARTGYLRFDPPSPQVPLIHIYIAAPLHVAVEAHILSAQQTRISCFSRLKPADPMPGEPDECYFEFNMGIANIDISDGYWIEGWKVFIQKLHMMLVSSTTSSSVS